MSLDISSLEIQKPEESHKEQSSKHSFIRALDLFSFLPVPKTKPVSSKRSLYGSLIMLALFFTYMIFGFVEFYYNNAPRVNQYTQQLPQQNISLPKIAFAFFSGDPFTSVINNVSILTFQMEQIYKHTNLSIPDVKITIPLISCNPPWVPDQGYPLLCPSISTNMSGALYQSMAFGYPRIIVNLCKAKDNITCITATEITQTCAGGRVLLFLQDNGPNIDLTTGQRLPGDAYKVFQFFLIPLLYPRAMVSFQKSSFTVLPDYLRRWTVQIQEFLKYETLDILQTNVSIYNTAPAYQIQFQVAQDEEIITLVYSTLLDQVAKWGAFWGVLFGVFAAYFLNYNSQNFYDENKIWENFDQKIGINRQDSQAGEQKHDLDL